MVLETGDEVQAKPLGLIPKQQTAEARYRCIRAVVSLHMGKLGTT